MNELTNLFSLLDQTEVLHEFYNTYAAVFLKSALAFALLNCFFGYRLRKVWSCIFGLLLGIGTGLAAAVYLELPLKATLTAAAAGGLICMLLAFLLYRIGMFFLCIGTVIMILFQLFPMPTFSALCGFLVFGIAAGFLSVIREHTVVICITAVGGGIGSAKLISLLAETNTFLTLLLAVILSALGLLFQFKPWRKEEYWKKEEEKNNRKRAAEKVQKKNRRKGRKKQKAKKKSQKPQSKKSGYGNSFSGKRTVSSHRPVSQNTPNSSPAATVPSTPRNQEPDSYTVDLSDIRSELSKEIQDIYQENQHNSRT